MTGSLGFAWGEITAPRAKSQKFDEKICPEKMCINGRAIGLAEFCMDLEKIEQFLARSRVGVLGLNAGEYPYAAPLNYVWREGQVYFHGMGSGKRESLLWEKLPVCFTVYEEYGVVKDKAPWHADTSYYEDGSLNSVFPLNGQIGFGWSEEDEGKLAPRHSFALSVGTITIKLNGIRFYPGGAIKSILFWLGETAFITTPAGDFPARIGLRFYEDGRLESFEPAVPITLNTPISPIPAYNMNALGLDADFNSVRFDTGENLIHSATSGDIIVNNPDSGRSRIASLARHGLTEDQMIRLPISLSFWDTRDRAGGRAEGQWGNSGDRAEGQSWAEQGQSRGDRAGGGRARDRASIPSPRRRIRRKRVFHAMLFPSFFRLFRLCGYYSSSFSIVSDTRDRAENSHFVKIPKTAKAFSGLPPYIPYAPK
jgi:hypothetical protein